jgi:hypothetical protein
MILVYKVLSYCYNSNIGSNIARKGIRIHTLIRYVVYV